jgi:hypothetical protein
MEQIILLIKILIILYIINKVYQSYIYTDEDFEAIGSDTHMTISNSVGNTISTFKNYFKEKNCCLVTKKFNQDKDTFEYIYQKKENCNLNDVKSNSKQALFIDGINGWSNNNCRPPNDLIDRDYLGSCKRINFECKDFVTKSDCNKFDMEWSDKTCHAPYKKPFTIKDRKIS